MESERKQRQLEEERRPKSFLEKAKSAFNRAKLSRYLGFIAVIVATVVISLYQVGWDPNRVGWQTYVANTALLLFLGIYGLFFGENEGGNMYRTLITGAFQSARNNFLDRVDSVVEKGYTDSLPDYIVWRYQKDYENACKMKLMSVRLFDHSILELNREQIEQLKNSPIKTDDDHYYSQLSEEQYQTVLDILEGKVFVDYIDDYTFYLNDSEDGGESQVTRVKNTPKRKEKITWKQRLSRVFMILTVSLILAGFFKQAWEGDSDTALRDLLSRLCTLVVSVASGVNTSRLLNLEDVFVLKYKESYLTLFLSSMDNKTFVPIDYQAKAKKEYEEYEKRRAEFVAQAVDPQAEEQKEPMAVPPVPMLKGGN
jgi:hypothetical protein